MERKRIATIMSCYNRKQKTLASLAALFNQVLPPDIVLEVYLVDDGSTDGTAEAVSQAHPQVNIIQGNGSLFWNGGMRQAFASAMKLDPEYYLWLNDDTVLYPQAIGNLLSTYHSLTEQGNSPCIVAGSTCDPDTGSLTYGGVVRSSWWHPLKFRLLEPAEKAQPCDTMNGNCVLIPREVVQKVGNLDPDFIHSSGDWDYGLRARQEGYSVWVVPGYVGTCKENPSTGTWEDRGLKVSDRWKKIIQAKGLPIGEWKVFAQRHAGPLWLFYWGLPYLRLVLISVFPNLGAKRA